MSNPPFQIGQIWEFITYNGIVRKLTIEKIDDTKVYFLCGAMEYINMYLHPRYKCINLNNKTRFELILENQ